jgi:hypothetical protein
MTGLPKLRPGMKVWRPVILHGTLGLQPQSIPVFSGTKLIDGVFKPTPGEFKSVWGDHENSGALPYSYGWRVSANSPVGTVTECANVIPCWTYFTIERLRRQQRGGAYITVAIAECHTDGYDELYETLRGLRDSEPDLSGIPEMLFDRQLFDQNWGRVQSNTT